MTNIESYTLKSNGFFSIVRNPYQRDQHPNQQEGLNIYVDVLDHCTGNINSVKLYRGNKGLYFKKGKVYYLNKFKEEYIYIPYQVYKLN